MSGRGLISVLSFLSVFLLNVFLFGCATSPPPLAGDSPISKPMAGAGDESRYVEEDLPRSARALHQLELIGERAVPPEEDEGFRIDPASTLVYGIDVSHWQATIDWPKVAAGKVVFAFAKATEGPYRDKRFKENWSAMARARQAALSGGATGFYRGAYHFFRATDDPVQQAENFVRTVGKLEPGDLPATLDLEWDWANLRQQSGDRWDQLTAEERVRRVKLWLDTVEKATGRTPIIYTNFHFWQQKFGTYKEFQRYPLWIADYSGTSANARKPLYIPGHSLTWDFWQFTCYGQIPGIKGFSDVNRFNGSLEELKGLVGLAPAKTRVSSSVLLRGSRGAEVQRLQDDLLALGHLSAQAHASGPGIFGPRTEQALSAFQRRNYLTRTGTYDPATRAALEALKAGLRKGIDHDVVRAAKEHLVRLGHLKASEIVAGSGSFGPKTETGIKRFQTAARLPVDGVLHVVTYRALYDTASRSVESEDAGPGEESWLPEPVIDPAEPG